MLIIVMHIAVLVASLYILDDKFVFIWLLQLQDIIEEVTASFV